MSRWAGDNAGDRERGHVGEVQFCLRVLMAGGKIRAAHPTVMRELGVKGQPLPDNSPVDVVLDGGHAHEVKVKYPNVAGCYGLEEYRLGKLTSAIDNWRQPYPFTSYTIFDTDTREWVTAEARTLVGAHTDAVVGNTYYGGETRQMVTLYWPASRFHRTSWPITGTRLLDPAFAPFDTPCLCGHQVACHVTGRSGGGWPMYDPVWRYTTGGCSDPTCGCAAAALTTDDHTATEPPNDH